MEQFQNLSRIITIEDVLDNKTMAFTRTFEEFEFELDSELELRGGDL